jgi:hypothetical protein
MMITTAALFQPKHTLIVGQPGVAAAKLADVLMIVVFGGDDRAVDGSRQIGNHRAAYQNKPKHL